MRCVFIFLLVLSTFSASAKATSESIGSYSNGCFIGEKMEISGKGYELMRLERKRNFGNVELIKFVKEFAANFYNETGKRILISDLAQEKGGPMKGAHASHQTGLDIDIWNTFLSGDNKLSLAERKDLQPNEIVLKDGKTLTKHWGKLNEKAILSAASHENVDRIFVNAAIKKTFCERHYEHPAQYKIRAWWGHDMHFHVRLKCPENSPECEKQAALDENDNGCEPKKLSWWFSKEAIEELLKNKLKKPEPKILPERCQKMLGRKTAN
jgi:penicillin-insensitive murein endopeptidase